MKRNRKFLLIFVGIAVLVVLLFSGKLLMFSIFPNASVGIHVSNTWTMVHGGSAMDFTITAVSGTAVTISEVVRIGGIIGPPSTYIIDVSYPFGNFGSSNQDNQPQWLVRANLNVGDGVIYNNQNVLGPWSNVSYITSRVYLGYSRQVAVVRNDFQLYQNPTVVTTYYYFDKVTGILVEEDTDTGSYYAISQSNVIPEFSSILLLFYLFSLTLVFVWLKKKHFFFNTFELESLRR